MRRALYRAIVRVVDGLDPKDDAQRLAKGAKRNLARKANVRSMTACAGLSPHPYHDNAADSTSS